jgi:hypothetical protein
MLRGQLSWQEWMPLLLVSATFTAATKVLFVRSSSEEPLPITLARSSWTLLDAAMFIVCGRLMGIGLLFAAPVAIGLNLLVWRSPHGLDPLRAAIFGMLFPLWLFHCAVFGLFTGLIPWGC